MTGRRLWYLSLIGVVLVAVVLSTLAFFTSLPLTSVILGIAVLLLAVRLHREGERAADLRTRAAEVAKILARTETDLRKAEAVDPMTHLANRGRFFERLQQEFRRTHRYARPLTCVMLDLDRFSRINEQYGEHFGDTVLAEFATLLVRDLRETDLAVRYEGEAFAILLPETPTDQAVTAAERVRTALKDHVFSDGIVASPVTASFGIAGLPDPRITRIDDLVHLAEQALAEAKRRGRDRIIVDTAPLVPEPEPLVSTEPREEEAINETS